MTSPSEVHIQGTGTDPVVRARAAVRRIQQRLSDRLADLTHAASSGRTTDEPSGRALAEFCDGELRRHLAAGVEALHAPAAGAARTGLLVRALHTTAEDLVRRIDAIASGEEEDVPAAAGGLQAVLAVHFSMEQDVLLPALAELPGADLPGLVSDLGTLLEGGELERPAVVDVREIPHGKRHPTIFARYARLAPGEAFTLVNNHDPKPLHREFEAAHPGGCSWDYVESGPERWLVRIGKANAGV
ncbi:DUF2249 domain-containing protein [Streptomyces meridianus]|uniref:DUF2249 domain-containing protein n=1 Tax=Streptomyces meridianus TaxID=2938945 RepID=A0ABT0X7U3_9ACTN|nr:DUF2249 domain-containing protein [Streptomyces meridianus]MCM2578390.1 DUF2249 domain-containing protein [Streptomyces meridianus]